MNKAFIKRLCRMFIVFLISMLISFVIAFVVSSVASAAVPVAANVHKQQLRQQSYMIWGLDAPVSTFAAQIHQESAWNATAKSRTGATGLAQFMPGTANWIGSVYPDLSTRAPENPTWAIRALLRYDLWLSQRIAALNSCEQMAFILSAYNGGLGWVNKRKAKSVEPGQCFGATCEINPGIHPANQKENADYPKRILKRYEPLYVNAGWGRGSCT